jgi:hypothetical protein
MSGVGLYIFLFSCYWNSVGLLILVSIYFGPHADLFHPHLAAHCDAGNRCPAGPKFVAPCFAAAGRSPIIILLFSAVQMVLDQVQVPPKAVLAAPAARPAPTAPTPPRNHLRGGWWLPRACWGGDALLASPHGCDGLSKCGKGGRAPEGGEE